MKEELSPFHFGTIFSKSGFTNLKDDFVLELIYTNTPLYLREIVGLSLTQLNLLKAIQLYESKWGIQDSHNKRYT